jgi:hypothetical protein
VSKARKIKIEDLIGKRVIIGITRRSHDEKILAVDQLHGVVTSMDDVIHVRLASGKDFTLPPAPETFQKAAPGHYRLRSTGEVVVDPDFTSSWSVIAPKPGEEPSENI